MAFDILKKARIPPHMSPSILDRIHTQFGVTVDRESLVSSLTKKVARNDRFSSALRKHIVLSSGREAKAELARRLPDHC